MNIVDYKKSILIVKTPSPDKIFTKEKSSSKFNLTCAFLNFSPKFQSLKYIWTLFNHSFIKKTSLQCDNLTIKLQILHTKNFDF